MNDDERGDRPPVSEHTTAPPDPVPAPPGGGWQMPEPKFQQSSGYLPQGFIESLGVTKGQSAAATAPAPEPPPSVDIEPQPDLSEQLDTGPVIAAPVPPAAKQRSTAARVVMILLGLLAMAAFIAIFLTAVYYLFLRSGNGNGQF